MDFITTDKLEELETRARGGSDWDRAAYVQAKKKHDEAVKVFFKDEGIDFLERPSEGALKEFKEAHEVNPDDIVSKARYQMVKAQFDASQRETINQKHIDFRVRRQMVRDAAANTEVKATQELLEHARIVAVENPSPENMVAYATIKRRLKNEA